MPVKRPWLRFLLLGALLFAADAQLSRPPTTPGLAPAPAQSLSDDELLLQEALRRGYARSDAVVRRRLARNLRFALGDAARGRSDDSLVREALALGMQRSDRVARRRLIQRMALEIESPARSPEPTRAELARYLEEHASRWTEPARVRLTQIPFASAARARAALERLRSGSAAPRTGRVALPLPEELPLYSQAELAQRFGSELARAAFATPTGSWQGPVRSAYAFHLFRVTERRAARRSPLATVRSSVREALLEERARRRLQQTLARWRAPASQATRDRTSEGDAT